MDGGGARAREQSAETRVDPSLRSGTLGPAADCPRTKEAESISFEGWPSINGFRQWRMSFRRIIASSSTKPTVALAWASEVDEAKEVDQLRSSVYQGDGHHANFETLGTKVAAGLVKIMHEDFEETSHLESRAVLGHPQANARREADGLPLVPALPNQ